MTSLELRYKVPHTHVSMVCHCVRCQIYRFSIMQVQLVEIVVCPFIGAKTVAYHQASSDCTLPIQGPELRAYYYTLKTI